MYIYCIYIEREKEREWEGESYFTDVHWFLFKFILSDQVEYMYIYYRLKLFGLLQKFSFLRLNMLFLMKQVKHHNIFIYTWYMFPSVILISENNVKKATIVQGDPKDPFSLALTLRSWRALRLSLDWSTLP